MPLGFPEQPASTCCRAFVFQLVIRLWIVAGRQLRHRVAQGLQRAPSVQQDNSVSSVASDSFSHLSKLSEFRGPPLYAVPVFVLSVPLQTVQRYRCRRPDFVANEP